MTDLSDERTIVDQNRLNAYAIVIGTIGFTARALSEKLNFPRTVCIVNLIVSEYEKTSGIVSVTQTDAVAATHSLM